jgi:hypothetical protein
MNRQDALQEPTAVVGLRTKGSRLNANVRPLRLFEMFSFAIGSEGSETRASGVSRARGSGRWQTGGVDPIRRLRRRRPEPEPPRPRRLRASAGPLRRRGPPL